MFEYAVVIRRQLREGGFRWQLWLGSGVEREDASFLAVMNHAGALGFEAVAAGHFDDLAVPEVLLQRRAQAAPVEIVSESMSPTAPARKPSARSGATRVRRDKAAAAKKA